MNLDKIIDDMVEYIDINYSFSMEIKETVKSIKTFSPRGSLVSLKNEKNYEVN